MGWSQVVAELRRLDRFVDLATHGFLLGMEATRVVEQRREIASVLGSPDPFGTEETYQVAWANAAQLQEFAKEQSDAQFSYLHELGVVKLCSILENAIDNLALERLADPDTREIEQLASLEGALLPFVRATPEEQSEYLLGKLKLTVKASLQRGAGRFESLLNPIGLGGQVDPAVSKALLDLIETRHVIVHRGSVVDKQFLSRCPWRNAHLGEKLRVSSRQFAWHSRAVDWYVIEVDSRLAQLRVGSRPAEHSEILPRILEHVRNLTPANAT